MMEVWRGEPPQKLGESSLSDPGASYRYIQFDRPVDPEIDGKVPDWCYRIRDTVEMGDIGFIVDGKIEHTRVIRLPDNFNVNRLPGFVPS
jgi:hypothetical protein